MGVVSSVISKHELHAGFLSTDFEVTVVGLAAFLVFVSGLLASRFSLEFKNR